MVGWRIELVCVTGTLDCNVDTEIGLADKNVYTLYGAIKTFCHILLDRWGVHCGAGLCKAGISPLGILLEAADIKRYTQVGATALDRLTAAL